MKASSRPRSTARLSDSVHGQLNMYALAAGAAGVGVLALVQPAEGRIVYTSAHQVINKSGVAYNLDLNHDGKADFILWASSWCFSDFCMSQLIARPVRGSKGVEGPSGGSVWGSAYALNRGSRIGPSRPFSAGVMVAEWSGYFHGHWVNVKNRYLGLKFQIKGKTHYGWARLSVQAKSQISATLTGYAYETIANKPIIAGKTNGPDVITVQPASLGHLAAGASAIPVWRSGK